MFKKYVCIKQHDIKDCGAACLSTIFKSYGLRLQISKIREVCGTDSFGTNAYGLVKAAEEFDFTAKAIKGTRENLLTKFPLPAIANVLTEDNIQHYVVIHKITKRYVIVADPDRGLSKMKFADFCGMWTGVLVVLTPTYKFEKANETKGTFIRFFKMLIPQKKLLFNVFLMSLVLTVIGIVSSFYFKFLMDEIIPYGLEKTLHIISLLFVGLYIMRILLSALRSHLMLYLSIRLDLPLMMGYYQHVTKLPLSFFSTRHIGEITSRFEDAGAIKDAVSGATLTLMLDTIMVVIGGLVLYFINPTMFLFAVVICVLYAIIVYAFIKPFKKIKREGMEQGAKVSTYLIESIQGVETLKAFNNEDAASLETEKRYVKATLIGKKGGILSNIQGSLIGTVEALGGLAILWFGALMVIKGNITLGQLLTFTALLGYFMDPLKNLIGLQQGLQQAMVASDRLSEIIDLEVEQGIDEHKKDDLRNIEGNIELTNVKFRYGTRKPVLNDISLSIKKGEKVAIVGESGSGKTTLAKLLLNFYDLEFGEISLDDKNLNLINKVALRDNIGYVSQDVFLFSGSVESNLKMSNDISNDEMIRVCKNLRVHEFVNLMPKKYMSALLEGGSNLSGGQRQRLAIARALLKKPKILILDEATSNLDAKTEETIVNILNNEYKDLTSIIIAHRLSTIRNCDKVVVLDQGDIKEVGTHKELYESKGIYYNLWKSQIEG